MQGRIANDYVGRTIKEITAPRRNGYEPTFCDIVFTDGSKLTVYATTVRYDQYSSSPCLAFEERP
jgi:hypothetical protein